MKLFDLILIAVGLSMDAFAAALCKGLGMKKENCRAAAVTAFSFGFFQAAMPLTGWLIGRRFQSLITDIDHWVAFLLLAFLGVKMMKDAFSEKTCCPAPGGTDLKELLALSVATSIDALTVGITFAFLQVPILSSSLLIGLVTFSLSFAGVMLGSRFGTKHRFGAQMAGGAILILIGSNILVEHLSAA